MRLGIKKIIKLYWPTLIFGTSAIATVLLYSINYFEENQNVLGKILNLIMAPIGLLSFLALNVAFGVGDLIFKLTPYHYHEPLDRLLYQCEESTFFCLQFPTMVGMAVFLSLSIIIVFFLNLFALQIIKIIKKSEKLYKIFKSFWPSIIYIVLAIISEIFYQEAFQGDLYLLRISVIIFLLFNLLVVIIIKSIKKRKGQSLKISPTKK